MMNITLKLSETDVQNIIAEYLKNEGHDVSADKITFLLKVKTEGYGLAEHDVVYFDGVEVKL